MVPADECIVQQNQPLQWLYWCMIIKPEDGWNFCFVMPDHPGAAIQIVILVDLQMGWCEHPAYFCSATETTQDIIDWLLQSSAPLPPHPMEHHLIPLQPRPCIAGDPNWTWLGVYMDDFILVRWWRMSPRVISYMISKGRPLGGSMQSSLIELTGHQDGKDPILQSKLDRGDTTFLPNKVILGFLFNGVTCTVQFPPPKATDLIEAIHWLLCKTTCALKNFQQVVRRLCHTAIIHPSANGLFTPIHMALQGNPQQVGLGKHSEVHYNLLDLAVMIHTLAAQPTHVCKLLPGPPDYIGFCDASTAGAGGVCFLPDPQSFQPVVWCLKFLPNISSAMVSQANPQGT